MLINSFDIDQTKRKTYDTKKELLVYPNQMQSSDIIRLLKKTDNIITKIKITWKIWKS